MKMFWACRNESHFAQNIRFVPQRLTINTVSYDIFKGCYKCHNILAKIVNNYCIFVRKKENTIKR